MTIFMDEVETPIGVVTLAVGPDGLVALDFSGARVRARLRERFGDSRLEKRSDPEESPIYWWIEEEDGSWTKIIA